MTSLYWLPVIENVRDELRQVAISDHGWNTAVRLAQTQLDFTQTNALDRLVQAKHANHATDPEFKPVRLAILGSSTTAHLAAGIRVAGLRHKMWIDVYEGEYGQYWQELIDPESGLHRFKPTVVLFVLDGWHIASEIDATMSSADVEAAREGLEGRIRSCWRIARETFGARVIHQTPIAIQPRLLGNNEHRLAGSRSNYLQQFNQKLRRLADAEGAEVLAIDW
jgi:predicted enzyme involved in methoxymalonyl-ACP biosynthesis